MTTITHKDGSETVCLDGDGGSAIECASGYVGRCVRAISEENIPDARWAATVLNRYGHLVPHEADRL